MTKSYFPHFTTMFLVHGVILLGTWQLSQNDSIRSSLNQIGTKVLKLKVASEMIRPASVVRPKVETPKVTPTQPKTVVASEPVSDSVPLPSVSNQGTASAMAIYKAELRAMIDKNKYYPPMSRRLGHTGTVVVAFTLLKDGHIIDVRIESPSRYDRLNDSAVDAVKKVEKFKPFPEEVGDNKMDIKVPVKFFTI